MTVVAGRYDLIAKVALTTSGALWHGRDGQLSRDVALKETPLSAVARVQRLRAEARTLAGLEHPNVVAVFGLVEDQESAWLVEEWVLGVALPALLEHGQKLRPQQALGVVRGALTGLAFTHQRQVVHGQVSLDNILLDADGVSKLVDFGLASSADGVQLTPQVDVYGAGTVLASLLTGRADPGDLAAVSRSVRPVLERALAPEPRERYVDAAAFLAALEDAARRDYGADWLADAGVAGLVAAALTAAATRLAGEGSTAPASAVHAAAAHPSTGSAHTIRGQLLRPRYLVTAGATAAAVAVAVAVIIVLVNGSGSPGAQAATSRTDPGATATPIATKATPTTDAVAESVPRGRYQITTRVTSSTNHVKGNNVGDRDAETWTITMTCAGQRCTGEAASGSGKVFKLTFDGTTLRATLDLHERLDCYYSSGPNNGKRVAGAYNNYVNDTTYVFTPVRDTAGGPVRELRGTERATGTMSKGPGICPVNPRAHVAFAASLSRQG